MYCVSLCYVHVCVVQYSMLPRHTCARYVLHKVTELLLIVGKVHGSEDVGSITVVSVANYGYPNARDLLLETLHRFCNLLTNLHRTGCMMQG